MVFNDLHGATGVLPIDDGHASGAHLSATISHNDDPAIGSANDTPNDPKPKDLPKLTISGNDDPALGTANDWPNDPKPKDPPK